MPRSNRLHGDPWDPKNGQILCMECNYWKGSRHNDSLDFRTESFKEFQAKKAEEEWEYNEIKREWLLKKQERNPDKDYHMEDRSPFHIPTELLGGG